VELNATREDYACNRIKYDTPQSLISDTMTFYLQHHICYVLSNTTPNTTTVVRWCFCVRRARRLIRDSHLTERRQQWENTFKVRAMVLESNGYSVRE
jgi:hypothetical protein